MTPLWDLVLIARVSFYFGSGVVVVFHACAWRLLEAEIDFVKVPLVEREDDASPLLILLTPHNTGDCVLWNTKSGSVCGPRGTTIIFQDIKLDMSCCQMASIFCIFSFIVVAQTRISYLPQWPFHKPMSTAIYWMVPGISNFGIPCKRACLMILK